MRDLLTDGAKAVLTLLFVLARFALWCWIFYLTFFKADPTMRDLMFVAGITCLEVLGAVESVKKKCC